MVYSLIVLSLKSAIPTRIYTNRPGQLQTVTVQFQTPIPGGLVVRIRRSHRRGRGSIPRLGMTFFSFLLYLCSLAPKSFPACKTNRPNVISAVLTLYGLIAPCLGKLEIWMHVLKSGYMSNHTVFWIDKSVTKYFLQSMQWLRFDMAARLAQSVEHGTLRR